MVEDFLNQLRVRSLSLKTLVCSTGYRSSSQGFHAPEGHKSNLLSKIFDLSNPVILVGPAIEYRGCAIGPKPEGCLWSSDWLSHLLAESLYTK